MASPDDIPKDGWWLCYGMSTTKDHYYYVRQISHGNSNYCIQIAFPYNWAADPLLFRNRYDGRWNNWYKITTALM